MSCNGQVSRRGLLASLSLIPTLRLLRGRQAPTFSAEVKVVNVLATVRDKKGQIVRDLAKGDFLLDEDGRPQSIRYFSQQSDLPLTLGLLVDVSPSQRRLVDDERSASYTFFDQVLREDKDVAFVIHFDAEVELLQDITSSRQRLEKALESLERPVPGSGRNGASAIRSPPPAGDAAAAGAEEAERRSTTPPCWPPTRSCECAPAARP